MKRLQKQRKVRDTILIITNGKQTEKNYFNSITNSFKSMFSIKVDYKNEQPDRLVNYASNIDSSLYNQIWCVFDIDDTYEEGHLTKAIAMARKSNINIAFSNESFELWLLFHLTDKVSTSLTRKTYIKEINKLLSAKGDKIYKKNDIDLLKSHFIPNILYAVEITKKRYQSLEAEYKRKFGGNNNYPIWNWKSTTTVYQLIEALQITPKE